MVSLGNSLFTIEQAAGGPPNSPFSVSPANRIEPRQETGGASFVYRMHPADRFGGDPLSRAQHGRRTRDRTSTPPPAQNHGGLDARRLRIARGASFGPAPYFSQPGSGDARKIVNCPFRNSDAGVRVPDWQCCNPLAKNALRDSIAAGTYTFGSVLAKIRLHLLQVVPFLYCALLGTRGTDPGYGSAVVTD